MGRQGFTPLIVAGIVAAAIIITGVVGYFVWSHERGLSPVTQGCALIPYSGNASLNQTQQTVLPGDAVDLRGGMVCNFMISPNFPMFTFHFAGHPDNTFGDITVTEGNSKIIQTIPNTTSYDNALTDATSTLILVDANFDGYEDLQIVNNCGATGNCSYDFYLYDPAKNQFIHNDFLSQLTTPRFDLAKRQLTTAYTSSVTDFENDTYQFKNATYTLIQSVIGRGDSITGRIYTYQRIGGQMKLVSSTAETF